ncbi:glycosyltransferase family 2 protein [bacterium LRH843]|nr:glycosyltransferase family 2 protein [bacterium LRH843]
MIDVSFVIPAYNEAERIEQTLQTIKVLPLQSEIIVVDDGSKDETSNIAKKYTDHVVTLPVNKGKGYALQIGWEKARGTYIACLDADLEETAKEVMLLLDPLKKKEADITVSIIKAGKRAGMGVVKSRVQDIVFKRTGVYLEAPLSGQRAFHRKWLEILHAKSYQGFGVEAQMSIDLLRAGAKYVEIPTKMTHREMGKSLKGFAHRFRQWLDIEKQCREAQP